MKTAAVLIAAAAAGCALFTEPDTVKNGCRWVTTIDTSYSIVHTAARVDTNAIVIQPLRRCVRLRQP